MQASIIRSISPKLSDQKLCKYPLSTLTMDRNSLMKHFGNTSTLRHDGAPGISTLQALTDTSGSGKGVPLLVQMTISRQFNLVKQIGEVCKSACINQLNTGVKVRKHSFLLRVALGPCGRRPGTETQ